jgi:putative hemolysin
MDVPLLVGLIICVALSGFFSCSETAYTSLSHVRLERLSLTKKSAKVALYLSDRYERLLSAVLIGNNIVNIAATTIATLLCVNWFGSDNGPWIATVSLTVIILTFGEVTPKNIAKASPESLALLNAYPLAFFYFLFFPLTVLFDWITKFVVFLFRLDKREPSLTEDELKMIVSDIKEEGVIDQEEHDLIQKSIIFDDQDVQKIMTPWKKVVIATSSESEYEIKTMFEVYNYSRVPYLDGETREVLGFLLQKDFYEMLLEKNCTIESIIKEPLFFSFDMKISDAFEQFQKIKQHSAIVVDKDNKPIGIVTMEDIIEELVGEIEDEYDAEDETEREYYQDAMEAQKAPSGKVKKSEPEVLPQEGKGQKDEAASPKKTRLKDIQDKLKK